ncbi:hypothetical protein APHAL10511_002296 [Amanita phalloides]|nr:hypothetical protein APHAL10511_002296 [Amanita phalloides]
MPKQKSKETDEVSAGGNDGPTLEGRSPPPKRFISDVRTPKGPHSVIDDTMPAQQGLPGVFHQLDMPIPDGAMDDSPATADETNNNASVKSRLEEYRGHQMIPSLGESYRLNTSFCQAAIDALTVLMLPAIFNTTDDSLRQVYDGIIIENPWIVHKLFDAYKSGEYHKIRRLAIFTAMLGRSSVEKISEEAILRDGIMGLEKTLASAYNKPFVGSHAKQFVEYLKSTDAAIMSANKVVYTKAFAIVQSSGTGKSRMLTEAGNHIFTLPICLRKKGAPGYPPPDLDVDKYFDRVTKNNDLSYSAHIAVACFIAAAHTTMHLWLEDAQRKSKGDLRAYWHGIMEAEERQYRKLFFEGC